VSGMETLNDRLECFYAALRNLDRLEHEDFREVWPLFDRSRNDKRPSVFIRRQAHPANTSRKTPKITSNVFRDTAPNLLTNLT